MLPNLSDLLVQNALGIKSHNGVTYSTTADRLANQMPSGVAGINHGENLTCITRQQTTKRIKPTIMSGIAVDGTVVLLTVTIQ